MLSKILKEYVDSIAGYSVSEKEAIEFLKGIEEYYDLQGNISSEKVRRKTSRPSDGKAQSFQDVSRG